MARVASAKLPEDSDSNGLGQPMAPSKTFNKINVLKKIENLPIAAYWSRVRRLLIGGPMMLRQRLNEDLKMAMRDKDARRMGTLRLILAAVKEQEIAARGTGGDADVTDDQILLIMAKMVKQRRESVRMYEEGARVDLAEQELAEIAVIEGYLPKQLSSDEVAEIAAEVKQELGATGLKDMGRCMGVLKDRYAGRVDMGRASQTMKNLLT